MLFRSRELPTGRHLKKMQQPLLGFRELALLVQQSGLQEKKIPALGKFASSLAADRQRFGPLAQNLVSPGDRCEEAGADRVVGRHSLQAAAQERQGFGRATQSLIEQAERVQSDRVVRPLGILPQQQLQVALQLAFRGARGLVAAVGDDNVGSSCAARRIASIICASAGMPSMCLSDLVASTIAFRISGLSPAATQASTSESSCTNFTRRHWAPATSSVPS